MTTMTLKIEYGTGEVDEATYMWSSGTGIEAAIPASTSASDLIQYTVEVAKDLIEHLPEDVRPSVVTDTFLAFKAAAEAGEGLDEWSELLDNGAVAGLNPYAFAQILMNFVGHGEGLTKDQKLFAMEVADHMGPDYAQGLFHFAKLVTKLA